MTKQTSITTFTVKDQEADDYTRSTLSEKQKLAQAIAMGYDVPTEDDPYVKTHNLDVAVLSPLIKEIIGEKTPPTGFHKHISPYDLYHNMYIDEALERARERGFDV